MKTGNKTVGIFLHRTPFYSFFVKATMWTIRGCYYLGHAPISYKSSRQQWRSCFLSALLSSRFLPRVNERLECRVSYEWVITGNFLCYFTAVWTTTPHSHCRCHCCCPCSLSILPSFYSWFSYSFSCLSSLSLSLKHSGTMLHLFLTVTFFTSFSSSCSLYFFSSFLLSFFSSSKHHGRMLQVTRSIPDNVIALATFSFDNDSWIIFIVVSLELAEEEWQV